MYPLITVEVHNLNGKELDLVPWAGRASLQGDCLKLLWMGLPHGCICFYTLTVGVLDSYLLKKKQKQRPFYYAARFKNQHDVEERSQSL